VWNTLRNRNKLGVRILLGLVAGMLGAGMLLYLVPGQGAPTMPSTEIVARVDGEPITILEVQQQLARVQRGGAIPQALRALYTREALDQLVFQKELEVEARRLGIQVTDEERADRIRALLPTAFMGDTFVGMQAYAQQVLERFGMGVTEFESLITQGMVAEKFRQLVTDGLMVSPAEVEQEFRRRNEKVKVAYALVRPDDLQAGIQPNDADLSAYFEANKARYAVPERRNIRYGLLDMTQLSAQISVTDQEIATAYNQNLANYRQEERAHVVHILFKTVDRTPAEVEEIRAKAEGVLRRAKAGADFATLARENSEDTSSERGGDLGWIVRGQTVPEFEQVAFRLPKGSVSDLVQTPYGIHILKVVEQEAARTQPLDEVRANLVTMLQQEKAERRAEEISQQMAEEIRRAGRPPLEDLATRFNLTISEPPAVEAGQPVGVLGGAPEITEAVLNLRPGDVSLPMRTDRGYVVIHLREVQAAHPATLPEVRDQVLADLRRERAGELAKTRAAELARRAKGGEDLAAAARSMGLEVRTSELVARGASVPEIGTASQLSPAFTMSPGTTGDPVFLGSNWVVYRVTERESPNLENLPAQRQEITEQLLQGRREMAFEAFRSSLEARLRQEGKLEYNDAAVRRLMNAGI
jgi:peptidyl-prolyl cis-trans isomerase D